MLTISWGTQSTEEDEEGNLRTSFVEHILQFDCVTRETHEGTSVLTEHAVEDGSPLSDHKRADPRRISIEAIVTNTPLSFPPPWGDTSSTIGARVRKVADVEANVLVFDAEFDRIQEVFEALDRLRVEAVPLTVATRLRTYEDVQIVNIQNPRESSDGDSLRFVVDIQEVRIAETRTVAAPEAREPRGRSRRNRGGQEAEDVQNRRESTLSQLRDEYNERRANGESAFDAAMNAAGSVFGLGG